MLQTTSSDTWIKNGKLYYTIDGTSDKVLLFYWGLPDKNYSDIPDDRPTAMTQMKTEANGKVSVEPVVINRGDRNPHSETLTKGKQVDLCTYNTSDNFYLAVTWEVPLDLRGKKVTFSWEVRRDGNTGRSEDDVNVPSTVCMIPEAQPFCDPYLIEPMISDSVGNFCLPWMISVDDKRVKNVEINYLDKDDNTMVKALETNASGFIYLKVTDIHKKLKVRVDYIDTDNYYIQGRESSPELNVPIIHPPLEFKAEPLDDRKASVQLTWKTDNPEWEDFINGDVFSIQRSVTGREEDFVDLATILYEQKKTEYSYKDSTLLQAWTEADLFSKDELPIVKYRICRASTSQWGWGKDNPTMKSTYVFFPELMLLRVTNTQSEWKSEKERSVRVTWDYEPSKESLWYVWDDRAQMKLCLKMYQRDGQLVDSIFFDLNSNDIQNKFKDVILPRPCIKYEFVLYTYSKSSPIRNQRRPVTISNGVEWNDLAELIRTHKDSRYDVVLKDDITLNKHNSPLGTKSIPFSGTFDGNGHVISTIDFVPFEYVKDATIRNITIEGTQSDLPESTGMVSNAENLLIQNCRVDVDFMNTQYATAFVYRSKNTTIENCLFAGGVKLDGKAYWMGFLQEDGEVATLKNCVTYNENSWFTIDNCWNFAEIHSNNVYADKYVFNNCYYIGRPFRREYDYDVPIQGTLLEGTPQQQVQLLGSDWKVTDKQPHITPVVKVAEEGNVGHGVKVNGPNFYYESSGKVDKTLVTETRQSSVVLTWTTDGGPIDYFQVLRRDNKGKPWDTIAPNVTDLSYEDTSVSPLLTYEYMVRSAVDCEGTHYAETEIAQGACKHTGKVEGYIRYTDGIGVPGIKVNISSGSTVITVTTDDYGYFMAEGLSYFNNNSVEYLIQPINEGDSHLDYKDKNDQYKVTFNSRINYELVPDFIVTSGYRFSGFVMYKGTNIPVQGVRFLVNGHQVSTASGKPLETDFDGKYSFYVNPGQNIIQAVKDGHIFEDDGYFKSKEGYYFNEFISRNFFYDNTKVKLIGRVVGGQDQGNLPLGHNLSRNNLGDDVKMVLTLEGDNASWLIYDNLNPDLSERDTVYVHKNTGDTITYQTKVKTTRKRIELSPDPHTGEYAILLPPTRWKVQQVYAEGYASLFQNGKVSEMIDLTDSITLHKTTYNGTWKSYGGKEVRNPVEEYHAKYNCIYRAPVELTYHQLGYDDFDYYGDKSYIATNLGGNKSEVPLAYAVPIQGIGQNNSKTRYKTKYTFGYPVFSVEKRYYYKLSAVEQYYWNNNNNSDTVDVVKVGGGKAIVQNGMESYTHKEEVLLNDKGEGYIYLKASQMPSILSGNDALRTVTMTLFQDSAHFEAKPLKAYVLNIYSTPGAKDILSVNQPILVDILRDPPGGGSSATLSKGSKLNLAYSISMDLSFGLQMKFNKGTTLNNYQGNVAAPAGVGATFGLINNAQTEWSFDYDLMTDWKGNRAFNYTMECNEDITTSSETSMVGADADVYIGVDQNIVVTTASTVRAIPDSIFIQMKGRQAANAMIEIASGYDGKGNLFHLVRDTSLVYGPVVKSIFHHSQKYILTQLIPSLANQCKALMFTGTEAEAKKQANATGKPVYLSLLSPDDEHFGLMNVKDNKPYIYTDAMPDEKGMYYRIYLPTSYNGELEKDELQEICNTILAWTSMISENEYEKLIATELVNNYSVDGGSTMTYSENFTANYSNMNSLKLPFGNDGYFDAPGITEGIMAIAVNMVGPYAAGIILQVLGITNASGSGSIGTITTGEKKSEDKTFTTQMAFWGSSIKFNLKPVASYDTNNNYTETKTYNRKESFKIALNGRSHLDFDVYRVKNIEFDTLDVSVMDVFTPQNFYEMVNYDEYYLTRHFDAQDFNYSRGFVYRTRGGATAQPWENKRTTMFYHAGTTLDERTKKIENPKIKLDKQSVSGVPVGEAARFKVFLTNESEAPEAATGAQAFYTFYVNETTNPNGAKLIVDGMPLTGGGRNIKLTPGEITQKTLEVYAGDGFDYEGIKLGIMSTVDFSNAYDEASFDVHFLHSAGNVDISSPGDKWVMNTDAQYNEHKGWFMPVTISGFDKHQRNFDHIEFQYKESARGDDSWTNLCSFYADSTLMAKAGGTKKMIPDNDHIITEFYGEGTVWEMAYDIRAVLFCREGNNFITTSSKVLSGIKDTRRPQLFGQPEPIEGILDLGESIVFNFSEDIEYNYLKENGNFEVKGETNNDDVTAAVSLQFKGKGSAETEARRNFTDKEVTVEMLILPDAEEKEMPLFSHGTNGKKLQLWLTAKKHLKAVVDDQEFVSDTAIFSKGFTQVAMVILKPDSTIEKDPWHLELYNGGALRGRFDLQEPYTGSGPLIFGRTNEVDRSNSSFYHGRMMEARLWYRALNGGLLGTTYAFKRLNGNEMGLMDYYPMNEGTGSYAIDKTQGANAQLMGADWARPHAMSLHLEWEDKGIALKPSAIARTEEQNYTLMFWFKTDQNGRGALLSNGSGKATDEGAKNQFFIGFEGEKLLYRSNGMEVELAGDYSDNAWHHYAMTVNRAVNLVNIYVDKTLRASFKAEMLGAISGGQPLIGAAIYEETKEGLSKVVETRNWLRGNIDEICMFEQALPLSMIQNYSTRSPEGDETGLITYLGFEKQVLQSNNLYEYEPYAYSRKIHKDKEGNIIYENDKETRQPTNMPQRDYLFVDTISVIMNHIQQDMGAPTIIYQELKNLDFSFVGHDNKVLVNINEQETTIDKCNIYVTLRDIPDKNGNAMASPVTACFYVKRNPLEWSSNKMVQTVTYGNEDDILYFTVSNKSGMSHTYTIENLPKWLKLTSTNNIISPKDFHIIEGHVNKNLNVGTYNEIIYLVDENGIREPLYLTVTVKGEEPGWMVDRNMRQYTMNIIGKVYIDGEIDNDERDIVGVFDNEGICLGVANISDTDNLVYINVFSNKTDSGQLTFKLWRYTTGLEMILSSDTIYFKSSDIQGTPTHPVIFNGGIEFVQNLALKKGWNWVSFNVYDERFRDASKLLSKFQWQNGDVFTDNTTNTTLAYKNNKWYISGSKKTMSIRPSRSYAVNVQEDTQISISGKLIEQETERTIYVKEGWNSIGYTPIMNLTVETALSDYTDAAVEGDVIKSHDEFAYFTKYKDVGRWQGNLKYMKPGEGYMLLRRASEMAEFIYPFFEPGSTFLDEVAYAPANKVVVGEQPYTMSLSAVTEGIQLEPGDRLLAFAEGELRGTAVADTDSVFYMSIAGNSRQPIYFAIEREEDLIAVTAEIASFEANAVIGSPKVPTRISFTKMDIPREGWYTLDGIKLNGRPQKKGVYIYNGKKRVIE